MSEHFAVSLAQWEKFQFLIDFNQDGVADLLTDEEEPLGDGKGPNPARLLAAAIGNCLASSLLFCLKKAHVETQGVSCVVEGDMERNEQGRLRIRQLRVKVEPKLGAADAERIGRCRDVFEDFCIITQSVREGIEVKVEVTPTTSTTGDIALA